MPKAPEHLDESLCVWCQTKITYIAEGVANEKGGYDLIGAGWRHDTDPEDGHAPTPAQEGWGSWGG